MVSVGSSGSNNSTAADAPRYVVAAHMVEGYFWIQRNPKLTELSVLSQSEVGTDGRQQPTLQTLYVTDVNTPAISGSVPPHLTVEQVD